MLTGTNRIKHSIAIYLNPQTPEGCNAAKIGIVSECHMWGDVVKLAKIRDDWQTIAVIDEIAVSDRARWTRRRLVTASEILRGRLDERIA